MPFAYAGIAAAVVGAGASIYSASQQSDAVSGAAETQARSTEASLALQRERDAQIQRNLQPFVDTSHRLLPVYEKEISRYPTPEEVMGQPGYQFGLEQGQRAIDRKIAAGGGRVSGAAIKAAARFGTDYAASGYSAEFARREARMARLGQLAGFAPITAAANAGQASTNAITGLITNQGDAGAAAQISQGNIYGNAVNQIGAAAQRYFSQPQYLSQYNYQNTDFVGPPASASPYNYQNQDFVGPSYPYG